jgi:hypothetical protein
MLGTALQTTVLDVVGGYEQLSHSRTQRDGREVARRRKIAGIELAAVAGVRTSAKTRTGLGKTAGGGQGEAGAHSELDAVVGGVGEAGTVQAERKWRRRPWVKRRTKATA